MHSITTILKTTTIYNLTILLFVLSSGFLIPTKYIIIVSFGLLVGMMNLYLRAIMLSRLAKYKSTKISFLYSAGFLLRISFTALIGALLFTSEVYYVLAYMAGYVLHFFGIMLYGFQLKMLEGK